MRHGLARSDDATDIATIWRAGVALAWLGTALLDTSRAAAVDQVAAVPAPRVA